MHARVRSPENFGESWDHIPLRLGGVDALQTRYSPTCDTIPNLVALGHTVWAQVKVHVHTLDIAPLRGESPPQKRSGMARVLKGFHILNILHTHTFIRNRNQPYLPLPSQL